MECKQAFTVENLHFSYGKDKEVLHGISLDIPAGKITGILGANGCGKSTLLRVLAGNEKGWKGSIQLYGKDVSAMTLRDYAKSIAVVHQKNEAPPDRTVAEIVLAGRTPYRCPLQFGYSPKDRQIAESVLQEMELTGLSQRKISALSGGQMQRVWMAMALAQDTEILLLDEITTYLDIHYQLEFMHLIRRLNRTMHKTEVMVLHDINQAMEYCDYLIIMKDGQVLAQGNTQEIITEELLETAYGIQVHMMQDEHGSHCRFSLDLQGKKRKEEEKQHEETHHQIWHRQTDRRCSGDVGRHRGHFRHGHADHKESTVG